MATAIRPVRAGMVAAVAALLGAAACASSKSCPPPRPDAPPPRITPASTPAPGPALDLEHFKVGFRIALMDCAACHAIDQQSKSPAAGAPPLREFAARYAAANLAAGLKRDAAAGRSEMPVHQLNDDAANALAAFIQVISAPSARTTIR